MAGATVTWTPTLSLTRGHPATASTTVTWTPTLSLTRGHPATASTIPQGIPTPASRAPCSPSNPRGTPIATSSSPSQTNPGETAGIPYSPKKPHGPAASAATSPIVPRGTPIATSSSPSQANPGETAAIPYSPKKPHGPAASAATSPIVPRGASATTHTTPTACHPAHRLLWWAVFLLVWASSPCHVHSHKCIKLEERNLTLPPPRYVYDKREQRQLALTLDTSQRLSHQLTTAVVKILLEEGLGYQNVSISHYEEDSFNLTKALERLNATSRNGNGGTIPIAMINLEVWQPPSSREEDRIARSDCGSHSSGSRFGWYVSNNSYTQTDHITDHWRSFQRPDITQLFELTWEEDAKLRQLTKTSTGYYCDADYCHQGIYTPSHCNNDTHCATLFVGSFNTYSKFLKDQVDEEKLFVRIAWIGPNLDPRFLCTFRGSKPIVFFDWWPNLLSNLDEFMPVSFPSCLSFRGEDSYLCNYELHTMKKFIWGELLNAAKVAVESIRRFYLREEDYQELLSMYGDRASSCSTNSSTALQPTSQVIEDIACEWLQRNRSDDTVVWKNWLSHDYYAKTILWIAGIFPMSSERNIGFSSHTLVNAAELAYNNVNKNDKVLHDFEIDVLNQNGGCKSEDVLTAFIRYVRKDSSHLTFEQMIGVLGPACSETVEPLAGVAKTFNTVVLSYSAEGAIFSDHEKYPHFFRTIPENKMYGYVYFDLFKLFEWKKAATLTEDSNKYSKYLNLLRNMLPTTMDLENRNFHKNSDRNMTDHLMKLKAKNLKIIIGDFYASTAREVMCEAYHLNMTARHNYVWFLPRWFTSNWYDTQLYSEKDKKKIPCNTSMMLEAIDRHMSLGYAYYADDDFVYHENKTVRQWREEYYQQYQHEPAEYAGYTYDAVWAYAYALDKLLKEDRTHVSNLHSDRTNKRFVELIRETDFSGVSGLINFQNVRSQKTTINIMQFIAEDNGKGGNYEIIGTYVPTSTSSGVLRLDKYNHRWLNGIPSDGSPEETCIFETFKKILNVTCDVAIVIVMVLIFVVFAIILIALFIVYKKRYEKMVPDQQSWPLGELMSLDEWELPREKVVINRTIGEGAFGTVYGGECQFGDTAPWMAVAVKTLKVGSTVEEKLDFLGEAEMMKRFAHKNIVQLLGLCTHQEPIYMVMEFMLYGDLKTYLLARRHLVSDKSLHNEEDEISSKRLTSMALDVCRALAYLTELRYVHRDVACRNCLVSAERTVKLSDFGMTRPMYESDYYRFNRRAMLPVRWMSPESLEDGLFTNMSDMWSYGVLLYEIITFGSFPFQGMSNNQVLETVRGGNTITIPKGVKPQLERLLLSCWSMDPHDRPTFNELMETLTMWPRLITPCLEVPSAAVQINDTDSLEFVLPTEQVCRRSSAPNARLPNTRVRHTSGNENVPSTNAVQLNSFPRAPNSSVLTNNSISSTPSSLNPPVSFNSPSWNRALQENGGGPSVEPLLPQNGDAYVTRYVCLQRTKSGENSNDLDSPTNMTPV
nr:uncharacterized protein LOC123768923 isoform X1 [Procambarus clarkii]XP_045615702.1 uncharacterized protein LOC123768923 isoform X1 [Procambarus clarkii]XP_045615703.1 uncharacterized protein LOC123768923 isoform X1 [Procambarus clarkii]XP_045615704.1 uncharacterized protein LOC123768923 isoform X1 [Procambarus clarkii]